MRKQFNSTGLRFKDLGKRKVESNFDGGQITSDAGALLIKQLEEHTGLIDQFSGCFKDYRNTRYVEHTVRELIAQRIYGLILGYEDLVDHDEISRDPLMAVLVEKADPTGMSRNRKRDQGRPLAGKSTLNRLELARSDADERSRYKKIVYQEDKVYQVFISHFLRQYQSNSEWIVLDLDATDDLIHGHQEGRFFHGYYRDYCYLPLYVFCGDFLLSARLRPSNIDGSEGTLEELDRIIPQIRERHPEKKILLRADSGFSREHIMRWCEENGVYYLLGQAKNARLERAIERQMEKARRKYLKTRQPSRVFRSFRYRTLKSWSRTRRIVGKAEYLNKGKNPRFIVTNLAKEFANPRELYEAHYCARGDMENRIKEQQLDLFSDRTSAESMRANQLRLWFSSIAYMLMAHLRRVALKGTDLARAQAGTIRTKLMKIGACVRITVRRVVISISTGFPLKRTFHQAFQLIDAYNAGMK